MIFAVRRAAYLFLIAALLIVIWAAVSTKGFTDWPSYWERWTYQLEVQQFDPAESHKL